MSIHLHRRLAGTVGVLLLATLMTMLRSAAMAQSPQEQAKPFSVEGGKLMQQGKLDQAVAAFRKAYSLFPNARYQYNIGVALKNLGKDAEALAAFEIFATDAHDVPPEFLADAKRQRDDLAAHVATITVSCPEAGGTVWLDDKTIGTTPLLNSVYVDAGKHRLRIEKAGFVGFGQALNLKEGQKLNVKAQLQAKPDEASPIVAVAPSEPQTAATTQLTSQAFPVATHSIDEKGGTIDLSVSAGLNLWLAGTPAGAGPSVGFAIAGGHRVWQQDALELSVGAEAQMAFMSENDQRLTFTSLLASPTLRYHVVPGSLALFGRLGLGMMMVSGVEARSALLTPGAVEVTGALSAFEGRAALGGEYQLVPGMAWYTSLGFAYSPKPDFAFAESSFVRFAATTGASVRF